MLRPLRAFSSLVACTQETIHHPPRSPRGRIGVGAGLNIRTTELKSNTHPYPPSRIYSFDKSGYGIGVTQPLQVGQF
jgi:hypothetical protein